MKIHKIDQRSDEWFELRKGKMTASNAQAISANGKGLETYIIGLLAEKYSNNREHYTNGDMDRGVELEEAARMTYELEYEKVEEVGFIELDEYCGCSPDGLIGEDGGVEIKCHSDINHFKFLINRKIDPKYIAQIQMCLLITGRKWWDYVAYNQNFEKSLVVIRTFPDLVIQEKLIMGIAKGKKIMQELEEKFINNK